jgi:phosphoribosyl 1,2-cyclic phosphodiesterase
MSLFITSLNSGSNGNCYYVGNAHEAILVDAGISCREIEKRMTRIGLTMQTVKAVFISHEHIDHIRGLGSLLKKYKLPVYITPPALKYTRIRHDFIVSFKANEAIQVGDLSITPFVKFHDAADPYSFVVEGNGIKVGVITDAGIACKNIIHYFSQCHACFLESNYDPDMLENGSYPVQLKKRIRGGEGHLSNVQALELFIKYRSPYLSHLLLAHLSKNNNHPHIVEKLFSTHADKVNVIIASRDMETPVYTIQSNDESRSKINHMSARREFVQMKMFEEAV